jgi:hypothetical protein
VTTSSLRRLTIVVTLLMCAAALVAAPPATAAGLSTDKARQTAKQYAAEVCAALAPRCKDYRIKKCTRSSPKKVVCRTVFELKQDERCGYVLVVRKRGGDVTGRIKNNTCF